MARSTLTALRLTARGFLAAPLVCAGLLGAQIAHAQTTETPDAKPNIETLENGDSVSPTRGLSFNLPGAADLSTQTGPALDIPLSLIPRDSLGSTLFKLDLGTACQDGNCTTGGQRPDLSVTDTFKRRSETGLDLSLKPRAAMRFDDEVDSALVGAVIEIGEDLREGELKNNTWYFFAGADAEALTYAPESVGRLASGEFYLQDRIIVGDAQAGLGYRIGDADVSVSYMRREASTEEFSYKEDAATLSFTWKR